MILSFWLRLCRAAFFAAKSLPRLLFLFLRQMHIIHPVAGELTSRPEPRKFPFVPLGLFAPVLVLLDDPSGP